MSAYSEALRDVLRFYGVEEFGELRHLSNIEFGGGLSELSRYQLSVVKGELVEVKKSIEGQLEAAYNRTRSTMESRNRDWIVKANFVKRRVGSMIQKINTEEGRRNRKEQRSVDRFFVDVCRDELSDEQFFSILDKAKAMARKSEELGS